MARLASATGGSPSAVGIDNPAAEQSGNGTVVAGGPVVTGWGTVVDAGTGIVVGMEPLAGAESSGFEIIGRTPRVKITTPKAAAKISQPRGGRGAHHSREGRHGVLGGLAHLLGGLFHPLLEFVEMLHVVSSRHVSRRRLRCARALCRWDFTAPGLTPMTSPISATESWST